MQPPWRPPPTRKLTRQLDEAWALAEAELRAPATPPPPMATSPPPVSENVPVG